MRAGVKALSLLAVPLNVLILKALEGGERSLGDLSRAVGHPPASTLRSYLRTLLELDVLERKQQLEFPGSVSHALTPTGESLLGVGEALDPWLAAAPDGAAPLGSPPAKSAIRALADGWDIGIVRAIAARPFSLTELDRLISQVNYPTLERRLTAMRLVGQVEAHQSANGRGNPYKATRWLRAAATPLAAAMAWEHECRPPEARQLGRVEAESLFLLATPLIKPPAESSGTCRLAIEMRNGSDLDYAGVMVSLEQGKLTACTARVDGDADAWVTGSATDWFHWIKGEESGPIDLGGDTTLAGALAEELRGALSPVRG